MSKRIKPEIYILIGIPVLFLVGGLFHFLYSFTGEVFAVGLFAPVNESVFEHTKLTALPVLLWWGLFYLFQKNDLRADAWFTAALLSMFMSIVSIPMLHYFYKEAFGTELVLVDVLILLVALGLGQLLGLHYYRNGKGIDYRLALALMTAVIVLFAVFTIAPPKLPIFQDTTDGSYGVKK